MSRPRRSRVGLQEAAGGGVVVAGAEVVEAGVGLLELLGSQVGIVLELDLEHQLCLWRSNPRRRAAIAAITSAAK